MDLLDRTDPERTVLVVIDAQNDFVHPEGKVARAGADLSTFPAALHAINRLLAAARTAHVPCLFVRVEHGPRVDLGPYRDKYEPLGSYETDTLCHEGSWGAQFVDELDGPLDGERAFVKHGYDPFYVPEFEAAVAEGGTTNVIVVGFVTTLCVAATVASAFERGYFVAVPQDCVAAADEDAAGMTLATFRNFYAELVNSGAVIEAWRAAGVGRRVANPALA
jgi:ureidoacrylate peracid hydrolase